MGISLQKPLGDTENALHEKSLREVNMFSLK